MRFVPESDVAEMDDAFAFEVDRFRPVDHHFRNGGVFDQLLNRPETQYFVGNQRDQPRTHFAVHRVIASRDQREHRLLNHLPRFRGVKV